MPSSSIHPSIHPSIRPSLPCAANALDDLEEERGAVPDGAGEDLLIFKIGGGKCGMELLLFFGGRGGGKRVVVACVFCV